MKCLAPDYREARGSQVLLIWGGLPFWTIVDRSADRFLAALAAGQSLPRAVTAAGESVTDREVAALLADLRRAGAIGSRHPQPAPERLESLTINVTNRCNLACAFCYNAARATGPEVTTAALLAALDSLRPALAPSALVALLGGEPLLEPDKTLAVARWARDHGLRPLVSTNGWLVTPEFARQAADLGLEVQVSLDGATAAAHDALRGPGAFARARAAVDTLLAAGAHTLVSMVCHAGNVSEVPAFLRLARDLGVAEARFIPLKRLAGGAAYQSPPLAALLRQVADLLAAEPDLAGLLGRDCVSILARTCHSCSPRQGCGAGTQTLCLDADGKVYACPSLALPELAVGDFTAQPAGRLWRRGKELAALRPKLGLSARADTCGRCPVRHWCLGGCRGEAYQLTGDLTAPPPNCQDLRAAVVEMFWALAAHPELLRTGGGYC